MSDYRSVSVAKTLGKGGGEDQGPAAPEEVSALQ